MAEERRRWCRFAPSEWLWSPFGWTRINVTQLIAGLPKKPFAEDKECVPEHRTTRCELACSAFKAIAAFN
jgi:hypothetical protein